MVLCNGCKPRPGDLVIKPIASTLLDLDAANSRDYFGLSSKVNRKQIFLYQRVYRKLHISLIKSFELHLMLMLVLLSFESPVGAYSGLSDIENHIADVRSEFSQYTIIEPKIYHSRHKRSLSSTMDESGTHATDITLSYIHNGQSVVADLQLNVGLIPDGHFLQYQERFNGRTIQTFNKTDINLCHYNGAIRNKVNSLVVISTCDGINGLVHDGKETYYIHADIGNFDTGHYIFRSSDILLNATCGVHDMAHNRINSRLHRNKRSKTENIIRGPYNANRHSSFVELVIVVDNKVYKSFGESMKRVHDHCKDIANIVNALYVPLNIFVALVGVVIWNESNEIEVTSNGDETLKHFLHYRRNSLLTFPNDNAQLLTKEQFEGGVVGKALKGPICTYEYSGGVSMEHSQLVAVVATTVAHEMGHNFGMEHDSVDCSCEEEKCIMSASSTSLVPRHWSSCSIDQLNVAFSHGMNYCLRNRPGKLFDSPQCGNGFVEFGEQCDCGLPDFCENSCCNPSTCMLNANASCATGACCDLAICRPKNPGTECRSAEEECDLPEFCTGESEFCPQDIFKRDTETCDNGNAYCYKGSCRSRSNQCKILWGPSGESSDHCYGKNVDGNRHGNCGYDRVASQYIACKDADIHCGMLHCKHLNERLEFGMESVAILSHTFMNYEGSIIPCRTAIIDLGLQSPDPGLTPNGAKCGYNKMCVNQSCISIEHLLMKGFGSKCPNNCNGQGTCNSKGNCHCNIGYAPPDCFNPGQGGSIDSGPASNPSGRIEFTRAMYVFFLGIVPCIAIILLLTYYWKQNHLTEIGKSTTVNKSKSNPSLVELPTSTPSSTDDMNSALLKPVNDEAANYLQTTMFGKFNGFTLKPLPTSNNSMVGDNGPPVNLGGNVTENTKPTLMTSLRPAPPPPRVSQISVENENKMAVTINIPKNDLTMKLHNSYDNSRRKISDSVLETSTAKFSHRGTYEQILPNVSKFDDDGNNVLQKNFKGGAIKRISTFLKSVEPAGNRYKPKVKPILDREKLKNIEISPPTPFIHNKMYPPNDVSVVNLVTRTQSMRSANYSNSPKKTQKFHTVHPPRRNRPNSVVGIRPKSPPPRPPTPTFKSKVLLSSAKSNKIVGQGNYHPKQSTVGDIHEADESENEHEHIYAAIDECSSSSIEPKGIENNTPDNKSSLLCEIVTEIEKISGNNLYSNMNTMRIRSPDSETDATSKGTVSNFTNFRKAKPNVSNESNNRMKKCTVYKPNNYRINIENDLSSNASTNIGLDVNNDIYKKALRPTRTSISLRKQSRSTANVEPSSDNEFMPNSVVREKAQCKPIKLKVQTGAPSISSSIGNCQPLKEKGKNSEFSEQK